MKILINKLLKNLSAIVLLYFNGECTKNPGHMLISCKKSCNMDNNENCEFWAEKRECGKNQDICFQIVKKVAHK